METLQATESTHCNIEKVLGILAYLLKGWVSQRRRLQYVSLAPTPHEHPLIDPVSPVHRLYIQRHQLTSSSPILEWFVVRRADARALWIDSHDMFLCVPYQIHQFPIPFDAFVCLTLGKGKDLLRGIIVFVDATVFDANSVY